ncbi:Epimerase [Fasciola gigantica]|uniref:UDP-glucuronic acid decarboxylase 1 n=1 Tax=Fasciola gigantica TaxID=46835 RepID=A0A504YR41_FASGI|nr:Epimerase [Fasciola gigantica]
MEYLSAFLLGQPRIYACSWRLSWQRDLLFGHLLDVHSKLSFSFFVFGSVDEIYHLASPASPPHYMSNPIRTIKANTLGTLNMLGLARRTNAKFLFASTSEIYGDPEVHPQPETYWGHVNPIGPRACYDESKRLGETLTYAYANRLELSVRIARIFNTHGPRMQLADGRVVSNFIIQALQNKPITVYGTGKQTRSFQYVSDLVEGSTSPIEHHPAPTDDPQRRRPLIQVAKEQLNWEPVIDLKEGLKRTLAYFRDYIDTLPQ